MDIILFQIAVLYISFYMIKVPLYGYSVWLLAQKMHKRNTSLTGSCTHWEVELKMLTVLHCHVLLLVNTIGGAI